MPKRIVAQGGFRRMLVVISGVFLLSSVFSALLLYRNNRVSLGRHYGAVQSIVTQVKETLIPRTVEVNLIFFLLTAVGVIFLGILYSHRVAGPLVKVKRYAAVLGRGKFDERIRFRKKDAVHALAGTLDDVAEKCRDISQRLDEDLASLEAGLMSLDSLPEKSSERAECMESLRGLDKNILSEYQKLAL